MRAMSAAAWRTMEPPPELGSVLHPDVVHETMSLFGGTVSARQIAQKRQRDSDYGAGSIRSSPGTRFCRYKTSEGSLVLDDDRFDLVQRRITSADVDKILMGHTMGREIAEVNIWR